MSCYILWTLILGIPAVAILQVAWCCRMNKAGLMVAGVFMCISGAVAIAYGGMFAALRLVTASVFGFLGGGLYIAAAVCTFRFICGKGYEEAQRRLDNNEDSDVEQGKKKTSHKNEIVSNMSAISNIKNSTGKDETEVSQLDDDTESKSIKKTIYHLPDGTIRTDIETVLPDGSKKLTTTIENPNE
jgi:hypothetical protein